MKRRAGAALRCVGDGSNGIGAVDGQGEEGGKDLGAGATSSVASLPDNFSIIESSESMKDFAPMELQELKQNVAARRNTIFLLMEEVRRLKIQQRLREKSGPGDASDDAADDAREPISSAIPLLPPLQPDTLRTYYAFYALSVSSLILFGGLIAPTLELKLGIGGQSYAEFIDKIGLPTQLGLVDPIVASFVGGAVGVLSALLVVELNNVKEREKQTCFYCEGEGYLACGQCGGTGRIKAAQGFVACPTCSGTGKVMW